jgi:hypothetical protein
LIAMLSLILITLVGCNIMKEQQKKHIIEMMQQDEDLGLYEEIKLEDVFNDGKREDIKKFIDEINNPPEPNQALKDAAERYAEIYRCPATNSDEYCRHDIISAINFGAKWQQERSYSEEEVIAFGEFIFKHTLLAHSKGVKNLFEQFKKK